MVTGQRITLLARTTTAGTTMTVKDEHLFLVEPKAIFSLRLTTLPHKLRPHSDFQLLRLEM